MAGRIRSIEKSNDLIGNRTRDLPACSIVPQPTKLTCEPSACTHIIVKQSNYILFDTNKVQNLSFKTGHKTLKQI
jgi:hypothetical protein